MIFKHEERTLNRFPIAALAVALLAGCESEVTAPDQQPSEGSMTIDATSATAFVYVSLEDGGRVVPVADPSSTEWDIAFRRYMLKVNGGVGGGGSVAAAALGTNVGKSAEEIAALLPADGETAFAAVTDASIAGATFREDGLVEDVGGTWFRYDPGAGTLVANPVSAWKIRESDNGGFSVLRVSELQMADSEMQGLTLEYRRQTDGGDLGALTTLAVPVTSGPAYVDLSTGSIVPGTGCDWDLVIHPEIQIELNAGCDSGSFPLNANEDFSTLLRADDAPEYGGFLSVISGAIPNSIDDASGLFWYSIQGNNRLWPTYNIFLIKDGEDVYKLQVTDYYGPTGASGQVTFRFEQLK